MHHIYGDDIELFWNTTDTLCYRRREMFETSFGRLLLWRILSLDQERLPCGFQKICKHVGGKRALSHIIAFTTTSCTLILGIKTVFKLPFISLPSLQGKFNRDVEFEQVQIDMVFTMDQIIMDGYVEGSNLYLYCLIRWSIIQISEIIMKKYFHF